MFEPSKISLRPSGSACPVLHSEGLKLWPIAKFIGGWSQGRTETWRCGKRWFWSVATLCGNWLGSWFDVEALWTCTQVCKVVQSLTCPPGLMKWCSDPLMLARSESLTSKWQDSWWSRDLPKSRVEKWDGDDGVGAEWAEWWRNDGGMASSLGPEHHPWSLAAWHGILSWSCAEISGDLISQDVATAMLRKYAPLLTGTLWNILEHDGIWWNTMEDCGIVWNFMEPNGTWWNVVAHCGTLWNIVEHCGTWWQFICCTHFVNGMQGQVFSKDEWMAWRWH